MRGAGLLRWQQEQRFGLSWCPFHGGLGSRACKLVGQIVFHRSCAICPVYLQRLDHHERPKTWWRSASLLFAPCPESLSKIAAQKRLLGEVA